jgi:hypothetical protein
VCATILLLKVSNKSTRPAALSSRGCGDEVEAWMRAELPKTLDRHFHRSAASEYEPHVAVRPVDCDSALKLLRPFFFLEELRDH